MEDPAKQGSSRSLSGSDKDRSRVKSAVMPDSGEAMPNEHDLADKQRSEEGVLAANKHACG